MKDWLTNPWPKLRDHILPKKSWQRRCKDLLKEYLCRKLHVPFNRYLIPVPLTMCLDRRKPLVMIDVGAYIGEFTPLLEQCYPIQRGILVEPLPERVRQLESSFLPPQYQVFGCVLSNHDGPVNFEVNEFEFTSSMLPMLRESPQLAGMSVASAKRETITCKARMLDDLAEEAGLGEVDLLKIDVQGAEKIVLEGGLRVLRRSRFLWTEVSFQPLYEGSCTLESLQSWLRQEAGFELIEMELGCRAPSGEVLQGDALFVRRP